jgi:hypothetical protein
MPSLVLPTAADLAFLQGLEPPPPHWGGTGLDIYHRLQPDARDWPRCWKWACRTSGTTPPRCASF